jgi:hypothetical protein
MIKLPSQRTLLTLLEYNAKDGSLHWKVWRGGIAKSGSRADKSVRHQTKILGRRYVTARVIWKMVTGKDPKLCIDHKDINPNNNKWSNLRQATKSQNCVNTSKKPGRSNHRWIYPNGNGYTVLVRNKYIGWFKSFDVAKRAAHSAAKKEFGEFYGR